MIEFYPQIKAMHIAMVIASGFLFALRGAGVLAGMRWPMRLPVKLHAMFANGWLAAKLVLLVVYIGLGTFALKRGRTPRTRAVTYVAALCVFAFIVSIARAHHPLGIVFMLGA